MIDLDSLDINEVADRLTEMNTFIAGHVLDGNIDQTVWLAQLGDRLVFHTLGVRSSLAKTDWGQAVIGLNILRNMCVKAIDVVSEAAVNPIDMGELDE